MNDVEKECSGHKSSPVFVLKLRYDKYPELYQQANFMALDRLILKKTNEKFNESESLCSC